MSEATVSSKGQVTIPANVRVAAGITAGSKLTPDRSFNRNFPCRWGRDGVTSAIV